MPITEWRLDGHIRAADGAGTPFTIIVEALWVRIQLGEPMRVRWDREGQKRFRLLDGRVVRKLGDKRYEVQGVELTTV
ncbi:MAG: hypothetical protein ABIS28_05655 [Caldimonas sp.]